MKISSQQGLFVLDILLKKRYSLKDLNLPLPRKILFRLIDQNLGSKTWSVQPVMVEAWSHRLLIMLVIHIPPTTNLHLAKTNYYAHYQRAVTACWRTTPHTNATLQDLRQATVEFIREVPILTKDIILPTRLFEHVLLVSYDRTRANRDYTLSQRCARIRVRMIC